MHWNLVALGLNVLDLQNKYLTNRGAHPSKKNSWKFEEILKRLKAGKFGQNSLKQAKNK